MMWTHFRYSFMRALREINGIPEGCRAPMWIAVMHHILFPLHWAYERQAHVKYEVLYDCYIIRGIRVTGSVYEAFKDEIGAKFEVVSSKDGMVAIRKMEEITLPMHEN